MSPICFAFNNLKERVHLGYRAFAEVDNQVCHAAHLNARHFAPVIIKLGILIPPTHPSPRGNKDHLFLVSFQGVKVLPFGPILAGLVFTDVYTKCSCHRVLRRDRHAYMGLRAPGCKPGKRRVVLSLELQ